MATGRIGSTPVLRVRWSEQPAGGTTVLSGLDDNSVALVYDVGYEAVYRNGVLLSRGNDYTATDGTTVTLIDATLAGDIIEIFANDLVPLTDAISKGQYNAKGALLSATAASTPAVLPVGTNGQVLTAASGESTGLQWATPSSGSMTQIATGTLSGSSVVLSSIPGTYVDLRLDFRGAFTSADGWPIFIRFNGDATANRHIATRNSAGGSVAFEATSCACTANQDSGTGTGAFTTIKFPDYANTTTWKTFESQNSVCNNSTTPTNAAIQTTILGAYNQTGAVTSLTLLPESGTFSGGTYILYGVK
jgi:hypothetical protein